MPPPAKKRKTNNAGCRGRAIPAVTRRTTRSQRPFLSIEMIGKVASFAKYGSDLMSICKAVGTKDSRVVRHTCLRNNMGYLKYTIGHLDTTESISWSKTRLNSASWVEVNTDWRKHCTSERVEDENIAIAAYEDKAGQQFYKTDPLILFNNPAVAVELDLIDVLKYLVEEMGIDVNGLNFVGYNPSRRNFHLLLHCALQSGICFQYLLSNNNIDVCRQYNLRNGAGKFWECAFGVDSVGLASFESIVHHRSFAPNLSFDAGRGRRVFPLISASLVFIALFCKHNRPISGLINKFRVLLEVGCDPTIGTTGCLAPLEYLKHRVQTFGEETEERKLCNTLISMMEDHVAAAQD